MADKYDSNGDYGSSYTDNFKRKSISENVSEGTDGENEESNPAAQKAGEYVRELLSEKLSIDLNKHPNVVRLIDQEISKVQAMGKVLPRDPKYVDIYREKPIKVVVKVLVPVREHPKFNFVGKLLGPKGNSMKRLQEETMCKMAVLGRGSMKDRAKEDELRNSLDPKYAHLTDDLHVEISALGPPAEAHARVAFALAEVRKYLIPDNNDNIRQEQMREMEIMTGTEPVPEERTASRRPPSILREKAFVDVALDSNEYRSPQILWKSRKHISRTQDDRMGKEMIPRPPAVMRTATRTPVLTPRVMPAKTKIMSILDRARIAMEESYGYDEPYEPAEPPYEPYPSSVPRSSSYSTHHYEPEYEPEYYRESSSSYEPSSQRWKSYKTPSSSSSRHLESSRYRTSPYNRPSK